MSTIRTLLILVAILPLASCGWFSRAKPKPHPLAAETVAEVNRFRIENGRSPLTLHRGLASLAAEHSQVMLSKREMSHDNFDQRLKVARKKYQIGALSENVQNSWGYTNTPRGIVQQWKDSPAHRDNMLGRFHFAGVGIAQEDKRIFSTLLLGSPLY